MRLLVDPSVVRHPKTYRLADALGVNAREARGLLLGLWSFAVTYREGGNLAGLSPAEIAGGADWPGDPKAFIEGLVVAGFLDRESDRLDVHDWEEHQGRLLAVRAKEREKKRRQRARRRLRVSPGTSPGDNEGTSPGRPRASKGRVGKGREGTGQGRGGNGHVVPAELKGLTLYEVDAKLCRAFPTLLPAWRAAHPGVDVPAEIRKAHAWEVSNPTKAKKDRPRFLGSWLGRAQDTPQHAPRGNGHSTSTPRANAAGEEIVAEVRARMALRDGGSDV